jgi:DNA (cytosine-5)-methyltransferase 1
MTAYYNEIEPYCADWLRNLIVEGLIAPGVVDERSITEVLPDDLKGFTQCHFFAGIGGWSYALRLAGWPDDRPAWTGSCPCQPFSVAGKAHGLGDERHLWPAFHRLVSECRPPVVLGEQVASKAGRYWLAGVRADLEGVGYAVGAADLCSAGVGAPHIRQRLYWVADGKVDNAASDGAGRTRTAESGGDRAPHGIPRASGATSGVADAERDRRDARRTPIESRESPRAPSAGPHAEPGRRGDVGGVGDAIEPGLEGHAGDGAGSVRDFGEVSASDRPTGETGDAPCNPWSDATWLPCRDGKARRIESRLEPLVNGVPFRLADGRTVEEASRHALLRGIGNAIVPPLAAEFVAAYRDAVEEVAA